MMIYPCFATLGLYELHIAKNRALRLGAKQIQIQFSPVGYILMFT